MEYELYHHGVKGMKWGVRRYQNKDGTLTPYGRKRLARSLRKEYLRYTQTSYAPSEQYKQTIEKAATYCLTDSDRKRIRDAHNRWLDKVREGDEADQTLDKIALKYAKKYYNDELSRSPDSYNTERDKTKLFEYALHDYGRSKAEADRPDLVKIVKTSGDKELVAYKKERQNVADKILGRYANTTVEKLGNFTLTVGDNISILIANMDENGKIKTAYDKDE